MKLELKRVIQIVFVLVVLISAFAYRTYQQSNQERNSPAMHQPSKESNLCDFARGCKVNLTKLNGVVTIQSEQDAQVLAETPLPLSLTLPPGVSINKAVLVGKDMFMGTIPVIFEAGQTNQSWQGELLLGACITDKMIWQMKLSLSQAEITEDVTFEFEMRNHY
ncbi:hypothetical protein Q4519_16235 [Motilimonas sp. 1_MG-2023]|uniref:hypothetical protein n=1 Tax=Motilimonas sp. 1_MG-2023 TaxID=3062672 RepID=UPI0026E22533|nr:hypothetical protein [Motilimonas sp. 1_MG-2023]MDO6527228.1 hypothetical protein [Motilimonas sp. 1_MG-2023]